jgi:hypothetical protein
MPGQQPGGCGCWICSGQMCQVSYVQCSSPKAFCGNLASAVSWDRRHRLSKVLIMIEDEQRSLGVLEPVAAILYLPDEDVVWLCFVSYH